MGWRDVVGVDTSEGWVASFKRFDGWDGAMFVCAIIY